MALSIKKYRIASKRMTRGEVVGFHYDESRQCLCLDADKPEHRIIPQRVDSGMPDCVWGRIIFDADFSAESTFSLHFYATDIDVPVFSSASQLVGAVDGLLYQQRGRYLYIWIEVFGASDGWVRQMTLWTPSDPFINAFPEVYREQDGFFQRYMSIFSSIYLDFQDDIDGLHQWVDLEQAPDKMLPLIGSWLGITLSPELYSPDLMRNILRDIAFLQIYKGTKQVICRIVELVTGESCVMIERNLLNADIPFEDAERLNHLYGSTVYDYTLLIRKHPDTALRRQIMTLLHQFQPVRGQANLVFLQNSSTLGSYTYLDISATLHQPQEAFLDAGIPLKGIGYLR